MSSAGSSRESSSELQPLALLGADNKAGRQQQDTAESADALSERFLKACDNCRRRKVKCNGVRPSCGHCTRVDAPCHYSIKPKSRRMWKCLEASPGMTGGARTVAAAAAAPYDVASGSSHILTNENKSGLDDTTARLLARVETMERLLMQRSGANPPRTGQAPPPPVTDDYAHQGTPLVPGSMSSFAAATSSAAVSHRNSLNGIISDFDPRTGVGSSTSHHLQQTVPAKRDIHSITTDTSHGYRTSTASASGALSSPFIGYNAVTGNTQQTINQQQQQQQQQQQHEQHAQKQPQQQQQQSYAFDLMSHETFVDLIDTLFSNNGHICEIIHEDTFRKQFAAGTLSPLLLYSALASAARYSKNPAVCTDPPYSASAPFIAKAKALVVDAIEEPSLGNAQGLIILCMMHFSLGNEAVTTFYKALALNMSIVLGFNRLDSVNGPVHPHSNCGQELISATAMTFSWVEREAARRLWWLIFTIENYSSTCMGLAPSIQAEYCDVDLPASTLEWRQGKPQQELDAEAADAAASSSKRARISTSPLQKLSAYHAQLSLIFSKVAWLVTRTNADTDDAVMQFSNLNSTLQRWYESLPKELRISSVDSLLYGSQDSREYYQICSLHMRFYTTVIQLNHAIPEFTEDAGAVESGQRKCVIAASRVSDLLRSSFEIPIEMRDMNWYMCVFRAAHIHIYRLLSRDSESIARAKQDLAIHRRHLREGGPLWRICYKLLNRLDDMEQMVMLLPAQIPVAELIRLKSLTKNGKSQLVNMQLDALIKPSLIQSEHGDSEDLPLMARATLARRQSANQTASAQFGMSAHGINYSAPIAGAGIYGLLDHATKSAADIASMHSLSTPSLGSTQVPSRVSTANSGSSNGSTNGGNPSLMTPSPSSLSPSLTLPSIAGQSKHATIEQQQQAALQIANDMPHINTNIVIDNNMAETLVNYFYMVASNQPNGDAKPQTNNSQGLLSQGDDMSTNSNSVSGGSVAGILTSPVQPHNMMLWPDSLGGDTSRGPTLPSAASILAPQQQHQLPQLSPPLDASLMQMKRDSDARTSSSQPVLLGQLFAPSGLNQLKDGRQPFM